MSPFEKAFAEARKAGKKAFTFNGKSYHTRTKEEGATKGKTTSTVGPKARPKATKPTPSPMTPPRAREAATSPVVPPRADSPAYTKRAVKPRAYGKRATPKKETEAERNSRLDKRMRNAVGKF